MPVMPIGRPWSVKSAVLSFAADLAAVVPEPGLTGKTCYRLVIVAEPGDAIAGQVSPSVARAGPSSSVAA